MNREDLWTVAGGVYASKPRPALVIQDDRFDATDLSGLRQSPFVGVDLVLNDRF